MGLPGKDSDSITAIPSDISEKERALLQRDIALEKKQIKIGYN